MDEHIQRMEIWHVFVLIIVTLTLVSCGSSGSGSVMTGIEDSSLEKQDGNTSDDGEPSHRPDDPTPYDKLMDYAKPPGLQKPADVPMFVTIGFDDNGYSEGINWILNFLRDKYAKNGTPARVSFFVTTGYLYDDKEVESPYAEPLDDPLYLKNAWRKAYEDGHEIGSHSQHHFNGLRSDFSTEEWAQEMQISLDVLTAPYSDDGAAEPGVAGIGVPRQEIWGFRAPFLEFNNNTFLAAKKTGFTYDCSIAEGWQWQQNGTDFLWPYELKDGSPGYEEIRGWGMGHAAIENHPGLWEMPVHPVLVPPDYRAEEYGLKPGLRAKLRLKVGWFDVKSGKINGADYNMWFNDNFHMTKDEVLASLKYTLDLRLKGNRAPMMLAAHTDEYTDDKPDFNPTNSTTKERREAIEEFIEYALSKDEVVIVPIKDILTWVMTNRGPAPIQ